MTRSVVCALVLLVGAGCHRSDPPVPEAADAVASAPSGPNSAEPPVPAPDTPAPREALPRSIAGVVLGMSYTDAEAQLGHLTCHDNKGGFRVCAGEHEQPADVRHLEVYVAHDHVISVSYEAPAPPNAWDELNRLIARFGRPSLNGARERDKTGRLHEIYGWKDEQSLYSVRFVWHESEPDNRELTGTAIALWDRKSYQQWEDEKKQPKEVPPPPSADEPPEPI